MHPQTHVKTVIIKIERCRFNIFKDAQSIFHKTYSESTHKTQFSSREPAHVGKM